MVKKIKDILKNIILIRKIQYICTKIIILLTGERRWVSYIYRKEMGKKINLDKPFTLNEKMVWLKINYLQENYLYCCDKYLIHSYLEKRLGRDYAPRLLYVTQNVKSLRMDKIKEFPCIIKVSNGSGSNLIVKNKLQYTDKYLQHFFASQIIAANKHTLTSREHQYLEKDPYIVVEKLLQDKNGGIPNDYKFLYINGVLQFIYCSVDRLGANVRHVYDKNWNRLHFIWVKGADKALFKKYDDTPSIAKPESFEKMKELSEELAKDFPLVRIDFYETEDNLYIGEITLHHGSGSDKFYPEKYDKIYGERLVLPQANRTPK